MHVFPTFILATCSSLGITISSRSLVLLHSAFPTLPFKLLVPVAHHLFAGRLVASTWRHSLGITSHKDRLLCTKLPWIGSRTSSVCGTTSSVGSLYPREELRWAHDDTLTDTREELRKKEAVKEFF